MHAVLHRCFRDAVRWKKIPFNPADSADPPKLSADDDRDEMQVWTPAQVQTFLAHVQAERLYALWALAFSTGMRRGELCGLRWSDVDLDAGRLRVAQTLARVGKRLEYGTPKSKRSRRSLPLDTRTVAALKSWKAQQARERLAWGPAYNDTGLVFNREDGSPLSPDGVGKAFEVRARKSKLPIIRLHDIRHTYASISLASGVNIKVLSERLGHATVAFTLDVYGHLLPGMQEDAAEQVAGLIFGA